MPGPQPPPLVPGHMGYPSEDECRAMFTTLAFLDFVGDKDAVEAFERKLPVRARRLRELGRKRIASGAWLPSGEPPAPLSGEQSHDGLCEQIASTISGATWDEPVFGPVNMVDLVGYVLHRAEQAGWRPDPAERELASEREKRERAEETLSDLIEREVVEALMARVVTRGMGQGWESVVGFAALGDSIKHAKARLRRNVARFVSDIFASLDAGGSGAAREAVARASWKQLQEFDAWLSFGPDPAEILPAFRKAFGTDTSQSAGGGTSSSGVAPPPADHQGDDDRPERVEWEFGDWLCTLTRSGWLTAQTKDHLAPDAIAFQLHMPPFAREGTVRMWSPSLPADREALIERASIALNAVVVDKPTARSLAAVAVDALAGVVPDQPTRDELVDALRRAKNDEVEDVEGIRGRAEMVERHRAGGRGLSAEPSEEVVRSVLREALFGLGLGQAKRFEAADSILDALRLKGWRVDAVSSTETDGEDEDMRGGPYMVYVQHGKPDQDAPQIGLWTGSLENATNEAAQAILDLFQFNHDSLTIRLLRTDEKDPRKPVSADEVRGILKGYETPAERDAGLLAVLADPDDGLVGAVVQSSPQVEGPNVAKAIIAAIHDRLSEHRGTGSEGALTRSRWEAIKAEAAGVDPREDRLMQIVEAVELSFPRASTGEEG